MKIKHNEILPVENQPFLHCKLDRQKYANVLTSIVQSYADGFVMAINGEWGTGKTTFVKMWQASLEMEKFKTVYFNAWENDFDNEPLTAILGELKNLVGSKSESYKSLLTKGAIIAKNILPAVAKGVVGKYLDSGVALDVIEKSLEAATELLDNEINEYVSKKQGLADFKIELERFIEKNGDGKPVVFIIDELDRCRPDFAVEVLEKVKHFFSVKGIVFVLSIDKIQLGHSIQGFYGSPNINTKEYLRRFIDIEYELPSPKENTFCTYLYDYYNFNDFFGSVARSQYGELREDGQLFIDFAKQIFSDYNYTLRQQEKIFAYSRIVLRSFPDNHYVFPNLFMLLIHLKDRDLEFYNKLKRFQLTVEELVSEYENKFYSKIVDEVKGADYRIFIVLESLLILFYNNSLIRTNNYHRTNYKLIVKKGDIETLSFDTTIKNETYLDSLKIYLSRRFDEHYNSFELKHLLNKIDLLENLR